MSHIFQSSLPVLREPKELPKFKASVRLFNSVLEGLPNTQKVGKNPLF